MHGGFDNTENVVHVEAETTREAVHAIVHVEAEATRQAVAQVRPSHSLRMLRNKVD